MSPEETFQETLFAPSEKEGFECQKISETDGFGQNAQKLGLLRLSHVPKGSGLIRQGCQIFLRITYQKR
jgi:hypothetical protein